MEKPNETRDIDDIFEKFRSREAVPGTYGLGRCVPHPPSHLKGFPGPFLVVFQDVVFRKTIDVWPIDVGNKASVVSHQADKYIWDRTSLSTPVTAVNLRDYCPNAQILYPDLRSASYETLAPILGQDRIAVTAYQRFSRVVAGNQTPETFPFSVREWYGRTRLSDYSQAAHDARRLGWLLQDPRPTDSEKIRLRLPTQWHHEYLEALLMPKKCPPRLLTLKTGLDQFLYDVIHHFRASILEQAHDDSALHEAIYDGEFKRAADILDEGSGFLSPQVWTYNGDGVVDFLCVRRKWAIELMRNRSRINHHLQRFKGPDGDEPAGAYHRNWPDWEWRIVDFYYEKKPKQDGETYPKIIRENVHTFNSVA